MRLSFRKYVLEEPGGRGDKGVTRGGKACVSPFLHRRYFVRNGFVHRRRTRRSPRRRPPPLRTGPIFVRRIDAELAAPDTSRPSLDDMRVGVSLAGVALVRVLDGTEVRRPLSGLASRASRRPEYGVLVLAIAGVLRPASLPIAHRGTFQSIQVAYALLLPLWFLGLARGRRR